MALKCGSCGYDNLDDALSCNLCSEVLRKQEPSQVSVVRANARYGRHAPLPQELSRRLAALAAARPGLKAVFLFTMSVAGGPADSAFGFMAESPASMPQAHDFLREADPLMPEGLISQNLQCVVLDGAERDALKPVSIVLLDR